MYLKKKEVTDTLSKHFHGNNFSAHGYHGSTPKMKQRVKLQEKLFDGQ